MLFEQYGPLDYARLTTSVGLNVVNDAGNGWAQSEATAIYLLGIVATRIVEWTFSSESGLPAGTDDRSVHAGTRELPATQRFLPLVLLLAAIVAGWTLIVMRRFLSGLTGLVWAGLTVSWPSSSSLRLYLPGIAAQFANGITNSIVVGVAHEDPGAPGSTSSRPRTRTTKCGCLPTGSGRWRSMTPGP